MQTPGLTQAQLYFLYTFARGSLINLAFDRLVGNKSTVH